MALKANSQDEKVASPCISQCCLDDKDVCLGCGRHIDEITGWHSANNEQRKKILEMAKARKADRPSIYTKL